MTIAQAKQDTATIRKVLNYTGGRPYSEKRSYGRRVKFWWTDSPACGVQTATELLKEAFGD